MRHILFRVLLTLIGKMALSPWFVEYLEEGLRRCPPRIASSCPSKWAVSCVDHFNCDDILSDVIDPMVDSLREIFDDVWTGQLSECRGNCLHRQHLLLNANLITPLTVLPEHAILVNVEQLSRVDAETARRAAAVAADSSDPLVRAAGQRALVSNVTLGVTVDDFRHFVALDRQETGRVWLDYSYSNLDLLWDEGICALPKGIGVTTNSLCRSKRIEEKTLDVVQLGGIGVERRTRIVEELRDLGHNAVVVEGAFGSERDQLLSLTKVGLNIKRNPSRRVPEVARILAYAASGAVVVSEAGNDDLLLQSELASSRVHFVPYDQIVNFTHRLLLDYPASVEKGEERRESQFLFATLSALFPTCHSRFFRL